MVPGLEEDMFEDPNKKKDEDEDAKDKNNGPDRTPDRNRRRGNGNNNNYISPDEYYPRRLNSEKLSEVVQPFAEMFEHVWPVKAPGTSHLARS